MRIGGFVSAAGGVDKAIRRATKNEFETAMFFIGAPQRWDQPSITTDDLAAYADELEDSTVHSTYVHALYLANPASPDEGSYASSVDALRTTFENANSLKMDGMIFHLGSHKNTSVDAGLGRVRRMITTLLEQVNGTTKILLENSVDNGSKVGTTLEQIGTVLSEFAGESRVGMCFDLCHGFAEGYNYSDQDGFNQLLDDFEKNIGFDKLQCFHVNDSKGELGSHVDRHANIGEGEIGDQGFVNIMNCEPFQDKDFILEIPGIDGDGPGIKDKKKLEQYIGEE